MSYEVLLVSEQRMKEYTPLDNNIRVEDITPYILNAQDIYTQSLLGTEFYNRLKDGVRNNDLNTDEQELLNDYVSKSLMWYSYYLMLPNIKFKVMDKGVVSGTSEETGETSLDDLKYLRQDALNNAEFHQNRCLEFLKDYPGKFPEYETPGTKGMYPNKNTPYFSGLVTNIPKSKSYYEEKCGDCDSTIEGPAIES